MPDVEREWRAGARARDCLSECQTLVAGDADRVQVQVGVELLPGVDCRPWLAGPRPPTCQVFGRERRDQKTGRIRVTLGVAHPDANSSGWQWRGPLRMRCALGRPLRPDEQVDHVNGVVFDDRLENLRILTDVAHGRLHAGRATRDGRRGEDGRFLAADADPVADLPAPALRSPVEFVGSTEELTRVLAHLERQPVVGLDVETALDFKTLCLVQIATRRSTFLIDALNADLKCLFRFFLSSTIKVIHNATFETRVLNAVGLELSSVFDTMKASRHARGKGVSHALAVACARELGLSIDKSVQRSDWTRRPLTDRQIRYAAIDAQVLMPLCETFRVGGYETLQ